MESPQRNRPVQSRRALFRGLVFASGLILLTIWVYQPSLRGGFLIDDDVLLTESRLIQAPDGLYRFWFTTEPVDYWPVSNSSLWLEWRLWAANPLGYRVTNLTLHCLEALLIWYLLGRLSIPGAWLAATLYAVHPVNVEAVAWISQRKSLLALLFSLLSTLTFLQALESDRRSRSERRLFYGLALVCFAAAVLSKVSAIVLPLIFAGFLAARRRFEPRDAIRLAPFLALAAASMAINLWFRTQTTDIPLPTASLTARLLGAATALWFYLSKALMPLNLIFLYPPLSVQPNQLAWWIPLLAAVGVTLRLWQHRHHRARPYLITWIYFCLTLAPALGFTEPLVLADHYEQMGLIGVMALAASLWATFYETSSGLRRSIVVTVAMVAVCSAAFLARRQSGLYLDSVTLFADSIRKAPESAQAQHQLGFALMKEHRLDEARVHLEAALRLEPDSLQAHKSLAATLLQLGLRLQAVPHLKYVLERQPNDSGAHNDLGALLRETDQPAAALEHFEEAIRLRPNFARAHSNLGKALIQVGDLGAALEHLREARHLEPGNQDTARLLEQIERGQAPP